MHGRNEQGPHESPRTWGPVRVNLPRMATPTPRRRGTREWRTVPLPPGWDAVIRPRILHRDPTCMLRTHCWGAKSTEVDHIDDPADHSDDNLRGVCTRCHAHRTGQQGAAATHAKRSRRLRPEAQRPSLTAIYNTKR